MKWTNRVLALLALIMLILCTASVLRPIAFERERAEREQAVKARLVAIGQAQERYRSQHGHYCPTLRELVKAGLLADSLRRIPYSGGREFTMQVSAMEAADGEPMSSMECSAPLADYLKGMDDRQREALEHKATEAGEYPGLKIGDLNRPNYYGPNW